MAGREEKGTVNSLSRSTLYRHQEELFQDLNGLEYFRESCFAANDVEMQDDEEEPVGSVVDSDDESLISVEPQEQFEEDDVSWTETTLPEEIKEYLSSSSPTIDSEELEAFQIWDNDVIKSYLEEENEESHEYLQAFLSNIFNISFLWNTDGVPVFKSVKSSLWPVLYTINELPFKDRRKKENILISGLWYGETHPNMLTFLPSQFETLNDIMVNGVKINESVTVRGMVLCGTFDMPAKASVLNFIQFNGRFGCSKCLQEGINFRTEKNGSVRCFPLQKEDPFGPERSHSETVKLANQVLQSNDKKPIFGVKGPSPLMLLKSYDLVRGVAVDYMHCVLLGVTKLMMLLWFDSSHKNESFSVFDKLKDAENRLLSIKPPNHISRAPRTIKSNLGYWKASEFRSFLLYYFVPVMYSLLTPRQFEHFYLLVHAIHLLLKTRITVADIKTSERFLFVFVYYFDKMYPVRNMTINIHSLLHLPKTVLELGPLYIYSLFHFEDKNGYILKLIHGTQNVPFQLASAVSASQMIPILTEECIAEGSIEEQYIKKCNGSNEGKVFNITDAIRGIGSFSHYAISDLEKYLLSTLFRSTVFTEASSFSSIEVNGFRIRSKCRTKETRRNSTTVSLKSGGYFSIDRFVCLENVDCIVYVAFGKRFNVSSFKILKELPGLKDAERESSLFDEVRMRNEQSIIDVRDIDEQVILLEPDGASSYICRFPNILECD
ncbi:uncharacterized protein [Clytia hemisphaerica]|uniref:uncharacterized protein n=1 Tax=Clytia hemisphaerica TaxID=252671 RepID=UPI0034D66025